MKNCMFVVLITLIMACAPDLLEPPFPSEEKPFMRMKGTPIQVVPGGVPEILIEEAINWIEGQVEEDFLTQVSGDISTIYISQGVIPTCDECSWRIIEGCYHHRIGQARIAGLSGLDITRCEVTISHWFPNEHIQRNVLRHEILHCLGLRHSNRWDDIMNTETFGHYPYLMPDQLNYLRETYAPLEEDGI